MRKFVFRPITAVLSLTLLIMLAAYGAGLKTTHALPARSLAALAQARALLRTVCQPQHSVCGQVAPGILGATLLIGMARVRGTDEATRASAPADDATTHNLPAAPIASSASDDTTSASLGIWGMLCVAAWCLVALALGIIPQQRDGQPFPTLRICEHRISPAP